MKAYLIHRPNSHLSCPEIQSVLRRHPNSTSVLQQISRSKTLLMYADNIEFNAKPAIVMPHLVKTTKVLTF